MTAQVTYPQQYPKQSEQSEQSKQSKSSNHAAHGMQQAQPKHRASPSRPRPDTPKTLAERLAHALSFELTAIVLCAPVVSWVLGLSLVHVGALTALVSLIAMAWNVAFNAVFERIERRFGLVRNVAVRIVHAIAFELGLIALVLPLASWWLEISLLEALLLDLGILLFFLPYTLFFNLVYDRLRARRIERKARKAWKAGEART